MKLNLKKCILGVLELTWLGYNFNEDGISPEYNKVEAIKERQLPRTVKEVQSHLGLFQFFCELIDKYALIAVPFSAVSSRSHSWRGFTLSGPLPDDAQDAGYRLRDIIASRLVITFPDFSIPF